MEELNKEIRKNALTNGLVVGVIGAVLTIIVIYLMSGVSSMMGFIGIGIVTFLLAIVIDIFLIIDLRKKIGGFWNFKQAVTGIFIMLFVGYLLQQTIVLMFTNVVDAGAKNKMIENVTGVTANMMANQGADQTKIDEQVAASKAKMEDSYSLAPAKLGKGFCISTIVTFVFALIFAAIFKKEPPLFADSEADPE